MKLESNRLYITKFTLDMARDVHLNSLDEDNRRFVPDEVFETIEEARDTLEYLIEQYNGGDGPFVYPIILKTGENIGYIQLVLIDEGWEVGYHIAKKYTGLGYAKEAVNLFLPYIMKKMNLSMIYGVCLKDNVASSKVMEKCGFVKYFEGESIYQGEPKQVCKYTYTLLKDKYLVNGKEYRIIRKLGHGKGGYSFLSECDNKLFVLKKIHHEPCDYYSFGNKIESEHQDYLKLRKIGLKIPLLIDIDLAQEIIIKEFIDGPTIFDLVKEDKMKDKYIKQVEEMCNLLYKHQINIDYFPTNFIVQNNELYYIDYECNNYMEEWNFNNWGIKYWSKTKEFIDYLESKKG